MFNILFLIKMFPGSLFWGICFLFGILIWGTTNESYVPCYPQGTSDHHFQWLRLGMFADRGGIRHLGFLL